MLVLRRKEGERLKIGNDIEVVILQIRGDSTVSIGIEAPEQTKILRAELETRDAGKEAKP